MEEGLFDIMLNRDEYIDKIDYLKRNMDVVSNPPIVRACYGKIIVGYPHIPPQPCKEYIPITIINKICGDYRAFIYLDQIVSLMDNRLYNELMIRGWGEEHNKYEDNVIQYLKEYERIKTNMYPEDARKNHILLLIPSNKQFKQVWNRWRDWVWREKTLKGDYTPTEEGWTKDILEIVDALNSEGIRCIIVVEESLNPSIMSRLKDSLVRPKNNIITMDINQKLAKIGYVRDQSITLMDNPLIGNMALPIRKDEERTIVDVYRNIGLTPLLRFRWIQVDNILELSKMEGGNIFYIETDKGRWILTGIGVRGSNIATIRILRNIFPEDVDIIGIPLSGYIKNWSETGAVHLDVVLTYLGNINGSYYAVLDPMRIGFYSAFQFKKNGDIKLISIPELFSEMDIYIDEIEGHDASKITMANALNLGGGKLIVDIYNKRVNKYLRREFGVDIIEVDIPHIEAGGGGVRCVTREVWGIH